MEKSTRLRVGEEAPDFTAIDVIRGESFKLSDYRGKHSVALIFLRYAGCPLCQLHISEISRKYPQIAAKDTDVIVFVRSRVNTLVQEGYPGGFPFKLVADPDGDFYKLYGVGSGNIKDMLTPNVIKKAVKATIRGHKQGKMEGNQWQLPGDFIVGKDGKLKLAHVGSDIGDNLKSDELMKYM